MTMDKFWKIFNMDKPIMDKFQKMFESWINGLWINYSEIMLYG